MKRFSVVMAGVAVGAAVMVSSTVVWAQASTQALSQAPAQSGAVAPARTVQPSRSYRSYSVAPRGNESRRSAGEATWRHANSKAEGRFHTGR